MGRSDSNYNDIASGFAEMRDEFYREKKYLDLFIKELPQRAHILDVGCGSGHPIANYLISNGLKVTGIDASKELLKIAKVKCPKMKTMLGDMRAISLQQQFDGVLEWWSLFHVPKSDHEKMISRFASWLRTGGVLEFTTGDEEYEDTSSDMLNHPLSFYSLAPIIYEKYLKKNGFKILLRENDQSQHFVWLAKKKV